MFSIQTVAVLGATEAGTACALLAALAGCAVRLHDGSLAALDAASGTLRRRVDVALASGAITRSERQRVLDGLLITPDLVEALTGADLAVDAGGEAPDDLCATLAGTLRATATVATFAAAGSVGPEELGARLPQPGRVVAFTLADARGPVPRLDVLPAPTTSEHVLERTRSFAAWVNRAARTPAAP